jgi:hypothetical protein
MDNKEKTKKHYLQSHYRYEINRKAERLISKLQSQKVKSLAIIITNLNSEYVINHKDSTNLDTQKKIEQILSIGFEKSTAGLLIILDRNLSKKDLS